MISCRGEDRRSAPSSPRAARRAPPRTAPATRSPPPSGSTTSASSRCGRRSRAGPAPRSSGSSCGRTAARCACASSTAMPEVQRKVEAIAKEWEAVANLTLQLRHQRRRRDPDQLRRGGVLVVDGRHRRPDRAAHRGDDELRLARTGHGHPRVPTRRAPRVRPCPRHDPRAPEPRRHRARSRGTSRRSTPTTPSRAGRGRTSTSTSSTSTTPTRPTSRRSTRPRSCSTPCPTR